MLHKYFLFNSRNKKNISFIIFIVPRGNVIFSEPPQFFSTNTYSTYFLKPHPLGRFKLSSRGNSLFLLFFVIMILSPELLAVIHGQALDAFNCPGRFPGSR